MLQRCYYEKHNRFHLYGGRGIEVAQEWWAYPTFRSWANSAGWRKGLNIDRINSDGNYGPDNCRMVTAQTNQRNRRNNRLETAWGISQSLAEWADDPRCVVTYSQLHERMSDGWGFEDAMTTSTRRTGGYRMITAFGDTKSITEWLSDDRCEVPKLATLWKRINDGWSPERALSAPVRTGRG